VKNGKWKIAFVVPKDIKYNFGTGRIVYYASENDLGMEANGNFEEFIIGGESAAIDTISPKVKLYMNTPSFINGGQVNPSPLFVAEVFDDNGINSMGIGIGHNIVMHVSGIDSVGKPMAAYNNKEVILNNYYTPKPDTYKEGKVEYQFTDLENGRYKIKFKIWDMYNNSTNEELNFVVSKIGEIKVQEAYTYPNPAAMGETINFYIDHDHPNQLISAKISLCDVTGRMLCTTEQEAYSTGTVAKIEWNPQSEGCILSEGIYIVKLDLSTKNERCRVITLKVVIKNG